MDSNLLKVFVCVAQEKSISNAASKLNFAQSNVTSRIKQLEKNLGFELFHRIPKGVILTKEGEKLYSKACEIVNKIELLNSEMKNINTQESLVVGSTESNAVSRIVPFLLQLNKDFPQMELELLTNTTRDITQELLSYKVDIAFISGEPKHDELEVLNKIEEDLYLVENKEGTSKSIFLTFKSGCAYNELGFDYLKKHYDKNIRKSEFANYETILGCVKASMGVTIVPLSIVIKLNYAKELKLTKLKDGMASMPTFLVCRKDNKPKIDKYLKEYKF